MCGIQHTPGDNATVGKRTKKCITGCVLMWGRVSSERGVLSSVLYGTRYVRIRGDVAQMATTCINSWGIIWEVVPVSNVVLAFPTGTHYC